MSQEEKGNKPYKIHSTDYNLTFRATHQEERFPIAYASIKLEEQNGHLIGHLVGLLRHPDYNFEGLCRDLIKRRIEICKHLGCKEIHTRVYPGRLGIVEIYKSLDFKEIEPTSYGYRRFILHVKDKIDSST